MLSALPTQPGTKKFAPWWIQQSFDPKSATRAEIIVSDYFDPLRQQSRSTHLSHGSFVARSRLWVVLLDLETFREILRNELFILVVSLPVARWSGHADCAGCHRRGELRAIVRGLALELTGEAGLWSSTSGRTGERRLH